jgi:NitT/TauT family transport system substrate-binding protein
MRLTRRRLGSDWRAVLAVAGTLLLAGQAQAQQVWRHGMVQAKGDAGFATMVTARGFDAKHGLKVRVTQFKGDAIALKALLAGELDSYEGSPGGPMVAAARGAQVKIIGCYWPTLTYGLYTKPSISSAAQLKGKTFAISSPGALPDLLARAILQKYNIRPTEVRFAAMGSDADRIRALSAGVVDVAAASSEFAPVAKSQNIKLLFNGAVEAPNYVRLCIYSTPKAMAIANQAAARFLAAESDAMTYALSHRADTLAVTARATGGSPTDPRTTYLYDEVKRLNAVDPSLAMPLAKLQWMSDLLLKTGNLRARLDVSKIVAPAPRVAAMKMLAAQPKSRR